MPQRGGSRAENSSEKKLMISPNYFRYGNGE